MCSIASKQPMDMKQHIITEHSAHALTIRFVLRFSKNHPTYKITTENVCVLQSCQRYTTVKADSGRRVECHSSEVGPKHYRITVLHCGDI